MKTRQMMYLALIAAAPWLATATYGQASPPSGIQPPPSPTQALNRVRTIVVASPRAALVVAPRPPPTNPPPAAVTAGEALPPRPLVVGAAFNFTKDDAALEVREGTPVRIALSPAMEHVWYDHASGWLGSRLQVAFLRPQPGTTNRTWVTVGRDGAAAFRMGPSIGRAEPVSVEIRPPAGRHLLRAHILTFALPTPPLPEGVTNAPAPSPEQIARHGVRDTDDVYIRLNVVRAGTPPEPPAHDEGELVEPVPRNRTIGLGL